MVFNSLVFALFLIAAFGGYWVTGLHKHLRLRNLFIVIISYFFYGWWDYRFLSLILFSSLVDFFIGRYLGGDITQRNRRIALGISILVNLGLLGVFKYYNFFIGAFADLVGSFGMQVHISTFQLLLPVGISFYTFQTLSYSIDVYRKQIEPTRDWITFFAYVSFFPQLVAGPIERATRLLPQFTKTHSWKDINFNAAYGLIVWGFFKKIVIADQAAPIVNSIFEHYTSLSVIELVMGAILFAFQIYGDFSGYSDIAIGVAMLFGFQLMTNFKTPYFSRDIAEFWRRWHISLSTWFRDYVYIPLGGSKVGKYRTLRNVFVVFLLSGLWHGANWTFLVWGGLHALFFVPYQLSGKNRNHLEPLQGGLPTLSALIKIIFTFFIVTIAWVFFRAESLGDAIGYLVELGSGRWIPENYKYFGKSIWWLIAILVIVDWRGQRHDFTLSPFFTLKSWQLAVLHTILLYLLITEGVYINSEPFIYFQF